MPPLTINYVYFGAASSHHVPVPFAAAAGWPRQAEEVDSAGRPLLERGGPAEQILVL